MKIIYSQIKKKTPSEPKLHHVLCCKWSSSLYLCFDVVSVSLVCLSKACSHYSEHKANQWVLLCLSGGPAISVWVVVLWCKESKMSGSLVDQVNHALSLKQCSLAVAIIALTSWLTECFMATVIHGAVGSSQFQPCTLTLAQKEQICTI